MIANNEEEFRFCSPNQEVTTELEKRKLLYVSYSRYISIIF